MFIGEPPVARRTRGSEQSSASALRRCAPVFLLLCIVLVGFALRMRTLVRLPLWVDEAESSLNALSILQHGYPTDTYLGLPMFENILVKPWSGNAEYEFKDISYTDRGIAAYHAWLPLYSIAGSLRLFGISPELTPHTRPAYSAAERMRRTLAVRLPSVFFGMLAVVGLYFSGNWLGSKTTGLIAASFGSLLNVPVWFTQQARYYAATMAAMSLSTWMAARLLKRGDLRDVILAGISAAVLFYCHTLCFGIAWCLMAVCICVRWRGHARQMLGRLLLLASIPTILCLPWMLATGFLQQSADVPNAVRMVAHPQDLFLGRVLINEYALLALIPLLILVLSKTGYLNKQVELVRSITAFRSSFVVLFTWLLLSYGAFIVLMPIASFFRDRLKLMCLIPALLLIALTCTALISAFRPKHRLVGGICLVAGFISLSNGIRTLPFAECSWQSLSALIAYLQHTDIRPDTRIYASPNEQFVLAFYTAMPVQDIAPVRKTFLDNYAGHILYIERVGETESSEFSPDALQQAARAAGARLTHDHAWNVYCDVLSHDARLEESRHVKQVLPPLREVPAYASELVRQYQQEAKRKVQYWSELDQNSNPIFRGRPMYTVRDWWTAFFYGLIDYEHRRSHPNWEDRFRTATAESLRCAGWMIFRS